ncbi:MAG: endonuclease/exonuclease/phosphatase family protein, partial [Myxococcota bacterium]
AATDEVSDIRSSGEGARDSAGAGVDTGRGDSGRGLTVATFNVWFEHHEHVRRWAALLAEVGRRQPDVIAFQEVTEPFLAQLIATPWVREGYVLSDIDGRSYHGYGVMLLSRRRPTRIALHSMPSRMGRALLVADFAGWPTVATIHLESLRPSRRYRDIQFARCVDLLAGAEHAVLVGDMNFCATWTEENGRVPDSYTDVWPAVHGDDPGWTEDTDINAMLALRHSEVKQVRYDRVFVRSAGQLWRPRTIERLGTEPIDPDGRLFPSDHFGLCARFERD